MPRTSKIPERSWSLRAGSRTALKSTMRSMPPGMGVQGTACAVLHRVDGLALGASAALFVLAVGTGPTLAPPPVDAYLLNHCGHTFDLEGETLTEHAAGMPFEPVEVVTLDGDGKAIVTTLVDGSKGEAFTLSPTSGAALKISAETRGQWRNMRLAVKVAPAAGSAEETQTGSIALGFWGGNGKALGLDGHCRRASNGPTRPS